MAQLSQSDELGLGDQLEVWETKWSLNLGCVILFCGSVFFLVDVMIPGGSGRGRWHQGQDMLVQCKAFI